jgi:N-acetyl-anhydromuramyl-L-alanine amidase AmpD
MKLRTLMQRLIQAPRALDEAPPTHWSPQLSVNDSGWLEGPGVIRIPSKRHSARTSPIRRIVHHYTAGAARPGDAERLARAIVRFDPDWQASWHVLVDRWPDQDGIIRIYQSVPFDRRAWHAGKANDDSIGIELLNAGKVKDVGGQWLTWPYGNLHGRRAANLVIPASEVRHYSSGYGNNWHEYPAAQLDVAQDVIAAVVDAYEIPRDGHVSHREIDPRRKNDPGPHYMQDYLPKILQSVYLPLQRPETNS